MSNSDDRDSNEVITSSAFGDALTADHDMDAQLLEVLLLMEPLAGYKHIRVNRNRSQKQQLAFSAFSDQSLSLNMCIRITLPNLKVPCYN